jgi:molybdopterin converting factor small subunit
VSLAARLRALFGRDARGDVRVRVILKGRIGPGWYDVDRELALPAGSTLATLIAHAERRGIGLQRAIDDSPHLRHTLMWNGQRAPVDENLERPLGDGDQIYLLGPLAGG